jgi:lipopolysaccharide biosynthesis protein
MNSSNPLKKLKRDEINQEHNINSTFSKYWQMMKRINSIISNVGREEMNLTSHIKRGRRDEANQNHNIKSG